MYRLYFYAVYEHFVHLKIVVPYVLNIHLNAHLNVYLIHMARRSLNERNVRKLRKNTSGTTLVSLPIELVRELRWRDKQKVVVRKSGSKLIVEDWKG